MDDLLYRGVNPELYAKLNGELRPKQTTPFVSQHVWGTHSWGSNYWGESAKNAVIDHQLDQAGYPTSGVSMTPHLHRAIAYATHDGRYSEGYIFVVERSRCARFGVAEHVVNEVVPFPSVPEDDEVVLVAQDFGLITAEIIIEVRKIGS